MSIFVRPDSPPPRQPSPDITPAPLPYPHHPRRVASQPKIRVHSPTMPPGLYPPTRSLQSVRSYEYLGRTETKSSDDGHSSLKSARCRTRSTHAASSLSSPRSSPDPSPRGSPDLVPRHRRSFSMAVAPQFPSVQSRAPPVPAVPTSASIGKPILSPQPVLSRPIYLPDIDEMASHVSSRRKPQPKPTLPTLEKPRSMGITCLQFFGLRIAPKQSQQTSVTAM
ncbi:hypothetical protein B0H34DRAFT_229558 [Crassisporium funariophilum]|nr:hypothetical protein B0H34DRAFT_229558 [Crassisporium funariophilum]